MSSLSFDIDARTEIAVDSSVIINLNGSQKAREIIEAIGGKWVVTESVIAELALGTRNGHSDEAQLRRLAASGLVSVKKLEPPALCVFADLVDGDSPNTLEDGEASIIAYSFYNEAIAILDERKARKLCAARFSQIRIATTVDIILDNRIEAAIGRQQQADAMFSALRNARMRVTDEHFAAVRSLIGDERVDQCQSLAKLRRHHSRHLSR